MRAENSAAAAAAKAPLLVGRVRVNDELEGGDIVIMWTKHEGADRMKIFQRAQQNPVSRAIHRFYDWVRGNVNCTARLESRKAENSEDSDNALINLGGELHNVRRSLWRSMRPTMTDKEDTSGLLKALATCHIKALDQVKSFELSEAAMNRATLLANTKQWFPNLSEDDMRWLTNVLDHPDKVQPPANQDTLNDLFRKSRPDPERGFDLSDLLEKTRIARQWHRHLASQRVPDDHP